VSATNRALRATRRVRRRFAPRGESESHGQHGRRPPHEHTDHRGRVDRRPRFRRPVRISSAATETRFARGTQEPACPGPLQVPC
jgi:hypothetical protein